MGGIERNRYWNPGVLTFWCRHIGFKTEGAILFFLSQSIVTDKVLPAINIRYCKPFKYVFWQFTHTSMVQCTFGVLILRMNISRCF